MKTRKSILSAVLVSTIIISSLFTGCGPKPAPAPSPSSPNTNQKTPPDAVTTASIVDNEDAFLKATSKDGRWIIAILKNLTVSKDIVLEGDFKNSKGDLQRKIALYTQDANKKVTNRFTLTAPKMVVKSPNASIQHGTFKGDVYVETKDFQLIDATVDGNIYFNSDEAKNGFKMDATSNVTGKREVKKS